MENPTNQNQQPQQGAMPSNQDAQTPPTPQNPQSPNMEGKKKLSAKAIIGTIIFLLLAVGAAAGYIYREPLMSLISKPTPTPSPTEALAKEVTPDPTIDWKTFTIEDVNFEFKLPPKYSDFEIKKQTFEQNEHNLISGTKNCYYFEKKIISIVGKSYASPPFCTITNNEDEVVIGLNSFNYSFPSELTFIDSRGYENEEIPDNIKMLLKEYNLDNMKIQKVIGKSLRDMGIVSEIAGPDAPVYGTPGPGKIGLYIYTSNKNFPVIVMQFTLNANLNNDTIDQILSTFKFTDQTPTPTCMPRPACLDSEPMCLLPEPAEGWCP